MSLNQNQFAQIPIQGQVDLSGFGSNVIAAQVNDSQATPLIPGQAVKLVGSVTNGPPSVVSLASNSDGTFGFVNYNVKDASYVADDALEIALFGTAQYMTAGGAISAGASVEVVYTTNKVITSGGTNPVVGIALDAAASNGDLIRVLVQAPWSGIQSNLTGRVQTINVTATLAEINAGKILIPGITGQKIEVLDYTARVAGTFLTGTAVILESTNGTPVVISTIAEAALGTGAINKPGSANNTLGAGYAAPLGTSDGVQVVNSGSAQTGGTSIAFTFTFTQQ